MGASHVHAPSEIAQVVSLGDVRDTRSVEKADDIEAPSVSEVLRPDSASPSTSPDEDAPISLETTPYFHFDIVSAVRAAEYDLTRSRSSSVASRKSDDLIKRPLSEITGV